MKRKKLLLTSILTFSLFLSSFPVYASEPTPPVIPEEQTEETVSEYNEQVDQYNTQVDEYNQQVDAQYEQDIQEYNENLEYNEQEQQRVDEVNAQNEIDTEKHNEEEDLKVQQNEKELEQYEKEVEQYEKDLKNEQIVTNSYGYESVEDYNMSMFKTPDNIASGEYETICEEQAVDRKIVREENEALKEAEYSSTIEITDKEENPEESYVVTVTHHFVTNLFEDLKVIKEEQEVGINDTFTVKSLANNNTGTKQIIEDSNYSVFYTYVNDKYLSYYWYEGYAYNEYTSLKVSKDYSNENKIGDFYTYTLKNGTKYYGEKPYFAVDYYYFPFLTVNKPIEPKEVIKYNPDYWEIKYETPVFKEIIEPVKGKYLDKLEHLKYEAPPKEEEEEKPIIEEPKEQEKEEEKQEEETPQEEEEPRAPLPSPQGFIPTQVITAPPRSEFVPVSTSVPTDPEPTPVIKLTTTPTPTPVTIEEDIVPLAPSNQNNTSYWALINLLTTILSVILTIVLIILTISKKRKSIFKRIINIIISIVLIIIFILTEDMRLPMHLTDKYTLLMLLITLIQILILIFINKKQEDEEEEEQGGN